MNQSIIVAEQAPITATQNQADVSIAAAQQEMVAMMQARMTIAMQRPRNPLAFRHAMLEFAKDPEFAQKAVYSRQQGYKEDAFGNRLYENGKPVPNYITGPSIRLIEAAATIWGNIDFGRVTMWDTGESRQIQVHSLDLASNNLYSGAVIVKRIVERRGFKQKDGTEKIPDRNIVGTRKTSKGETVYLCWATEEEMRTASNSEISRITRNNVRRMLPMWIMSEVVEECKKTSATQTAKDPKRALAQMCDAFAQQGVTPDELQAIAGKPIDRFMPADIDRMRLVYVALESGETTLQELLANASGDEEAMEKRRELKAPKPAEGQTITLPTTIEPAAAETPTTEPATQKRRGL